MHSDDPTISVIALQRSDYANWVRMMGQEDLLCLDDVQAAMQLEG